MVSNRNGHDSCALCGGPMAPQEGPGRTRVYCDETCSETKKLIASVERAIDDDLLPRMAHAPNGYDRAAALRKQLWSMAFRLSNVPEPASEQAAA